MTEPRQRARVRTQLANERTFLAWLRSGLTAIALGVAAGQLLGDDLFLGMQVKDVLAVLLTVLGGLLILIGRWRYRETARDIAAGRITHGHRWLDVATAASLVVAVAAAVVALGLGG